MRPVFIISVCLADAKLGIDALQFFVTLVFLYFLALYFDRLVHLDNYINVEV